MSHRITPSAGLSISDFVQQIKTNANIGDDYASDDNDLDLIVRTQIRQALSFVERNHSFRYMKEVETVSPPATQYEFWTHYHWKKIELIHLFQTSTGVLIHTLARRPVEMISKPWFGAAIVGDPTFYVLEGSTGRPNAESPAEARAGNINSTTPVTSGYWAPDLYRELIELFPLPSSTDFHIIIRGYAFKIPDCSAANDSGNHWLLDFAEDTIEAKVMMGLAGPLKMPELKRDYADQFTLGLKTLVSLDEEPLSEDETFEQIYNGEPDQDYVDINSMYPRGFNGSFD